MTARRIRAGRRAVRHALLACLIGCGGQGGGPAAPLEADPVSIGIVPAGSPARADLTLRNPRPSAVTLGRVESSCPCIRVASLPARVPARGTSTLRVDFDPAEEPDFRGRLAVELAGYLEDGTSAFRTKVEVEVKARD